MEQKLLSEEGTVEQKEKGLQMMMQLFSALTNPIIGHRGWEDSITPEQKVRIKIERMKQIAEAKGQKIVKATEFEALVYKGINILWTIKHSFFSHSFEPYVV